MTLGGGVMFPNTSVWTCMKCFFIAVFMTAISGDHRNKQSKINIFHEIKLCNRPGTSQNSSVPVDRVYSVSKDNILMEICEMQHTT